MGIAGLGGWEAGLLFIVNRLKVYFVRNIEDRLQYLEKKNRWMQYGFSSIACLTLLIAIVGGEVGPDHPMNRKNFDTNPGLESTPSDSFEIPTFEGTALPSVDSSNQVAEDAIQAMRNAATYTPNAERNIRAVMDNYDKSQGVSTPTGRTQNAIADDAIRNMRNAGTYTPEAERNIRDIMDSYQRITQGKK